MKRFATVVFRELREAAPAALFFLVAFHMIAVTKIVILADYHVDATRSALATVGALIVAKAILIVEKLPIARWFSRRLLAAVLWKTLLFSVVATTFRILEEIVPLLVAGESPLAAARQAFGQMSWAHFWVVEMWLLALLFLYCLNAELVRALGAANVKTMLLDPRDAAVAGRPAASAGSTPPISRAGRTSPEGTRGSASRRSSSWSCWSS